MNRTQSNATAADDRWTLVPEAIPIAVLMTGLLVAIAMITHHLLLARRNRAEDAHNESRSSPSSPKPGESDPGVCQASLGLASTPSDLPAHAWAGPTILICDHSAAGPGPATR